MGLIYNAMTQGMQCLEAICEEAPARVDGVHPTGDRGSGTCGPCRRAGCAHKKLDFIIVDQESIGGTVLQLPTAENRDDPAGRVAAVWKIEGDRGEQGGAAREVARRSSRAVG